MFYCDVQWQPGTGDITKQIYSWTINDDVVVTGEFGINISHAPTEAEGVAVEPNDVVTFTVRSANDWATSNAAEATGTVPIPQPDPPTEVQMLFRQATDVVPVATRQPR